MPKPYIALKPNVLGGRINSRRMYQSEDIDALLASDKRSDKRVIGFEVKEVVREIECDIVEMLVNEMVIEII